MKCDELQYERLGDANETYPASTLVIRKQFVDAAITELKARIHELESIPHTDNSAVIERLSNENERLVKCCKEYDSRQRIDERIKFNGSKQLRATKRALWLARAERALSEQYVISNAVLYLENKFNHKFNAVRHELHVWGVVKRKCRSKAKEYK